MTCHGGQFLLNVWEARAIHQWRSPAKRWSSVLLLMRPTSVTQNICFTAYVLIDVIWCLSLCSNPQPPVRYCLYTEVSWQLFTLSSRIYSTFQMTLILLVSGGGGVRPRWETTAQVPQEAKTQSRLWSQVLSRLERVRPFLFTTLVTPITCKDV